MVPVLVVAALGFAGAWAAFRLGWVAGRRHAEDSIARLLRELAQPEVIDLTSPQPGQPTLDLLVNERTQRP